MFHRVASAVHVDDEDRADVFAPVADLMVAVVFIFMLLALGLSLRSDQGGTVPRADHDQVVAELAAMRVRLRASEDTAVVFGKLAGKRADEVARLADLVRFVRDQSIVPLMDRMARADQTRAGILGDMRRRLLDLGVEVAVNQEAGTLALPASNLFGSGRSDPSPEGREAILKLGRVLADVLPCYAARGTYSMAACPRRQDAGSLSAVYIEGHTDVAAFGAAGGRYRNNWDLSAGRAIEAYTLLRANFDRVRDLRNPGGQALVGVSGYADTRPAAPDGADRAAAGQMEGDRRIEIRLLMSNDAQLAGSVLQELRERLDGVRGIVR